MLNASAELSTGGFGMTGIGVAHGIDGCERTANHRADQAIAIERRGSFVENDGGPPRILIAKLGQAIGWLGGANVDQKRPITVHTGGGL